MNGDLIIEKQFFFCMWTCQKLHTQVSIIIVLWHGHPAPLLFVEYFQPNWQFYLYTPYIKDMQFPVIALVLTRNLERSCWTFVKEDGILNDRQAIFIQEFQFKPKTSGELTMTYFLLHFYVILYNCVLWGRKDNSNDWIFCIYKYTFIHKLYKLKNLEKKKNCKLSNFLWKYYPRLLRL